jgi:hypothetical protein
MAAGGGSLVVLLIAMSFAANSLRGAAPRPTQSIAGSFATGVDRLARGSEQAIRLRQTYRIHGFPKGQPTMAIALKKGGAGGHVSAVQMPNGTSYPLPKGAKAASVAPHGDSIAVVTADKRVVVESTIGSGTFTVHASITAGKQISWNPAGTALFALVDGHWVLVPAPGPQGTVRTRSKVRTLEVPRLPGGPSFLSVSPRGDSVLLFGLTKIDPDAPAAAADSAKVSAAGVRPHLYLARFDGHRVTDVRGVHVPPLARRAPVGWLGDNAFLISTGPGIAWIVRTNSSHVPVQPVTIPDACTLAGASATCRGRGPRLLGTNADGSLLFWRERASRGPEPATEFGPAAQLGAVATRRPVVAYFVTWLDGSHPKRLTGAAGRYGPPLAAR